MMFKNRTHRVVSVASIDELAEKLVEHTWTLCTGWELDGLLFLNDSTCEDGAGEWAVVIPDQDRRAGEQIESITFSWCDLAQAIEHIRLCLDYRRTGERPGMSARVVLHIEHPEGSCRLCA